MALCKLHVFMQPGASTTAPTRAVAQVNHLPEIVCAGDLAATTSATLPMRTLVVDCA